MTRSDGRRRRRLILQVTGVVLFFGAGLWLRSLPTTNISSAWGSWRPWTQSSMATLYFADGEFLFPVSRRMRANERLPEAALRALLDGPSADTGLQRSVPSGVAIRSITVSGGIAHVDLSGAFLPDDVHASMAQTAVVATLTALPDVTAVDLRVEGKPVAQSVRRAPLLYYASAKGLVAVPVTAADPRSALQAYLSRPEGTEVTSFPGDARLLDYGYDPAERLVSLSFTYSPGVRRLALDRPERMRTLLLGLITTLTEYPEVRAVQLDFEGQTRLGLGECSDLLRTPQPRPQLLNDERLLDR